MTNSPQTGKKTPALGSVDTVRSRGRLWLVPLIGLCLMLVMAVFWKKSARTSPEGAFSQPTYGDVAHNTSKEPSMVGEHSIWETNDSAEAKRFDGLHRAGTQARASSSIDHSTTPTDELISRAHQLLVDHGDLTEQQAGEINHLFDQMIDRGEAVIPLVREYLDLGQDMNFDTLPGGGLVHYPSLRIGLVDVLLQIGGPNALTAVGEALATATDPLEIGLVANELEREMPGVYRDLALDAARDMLAAGLRGGHDATPLFEVLMTFGDASVASNLEQAVKQYSYYATMTLAALPEGAGVPSLIRLAEDPEILARGRGDIALRMLAQSSVKHRDAWIALVNQVEAQQVPNDAWAGIASELAGQRLWFAHNIFSESNLVEIPSKDEIQEQLDKIDKLMRITTSPIGRQELFRAQTALASQLNRSR